MDVVTTQLYDLHCFIQAVFYLKTAIIAAVVLYVILKILSKLVDKWKDGKK